MNLNRPAIKSGPLTMAELHAAQCPPCHGMCHQGRKCNASACAPEGGQHRDPAPTKTHRPGLGVVLVLLGWPAVAAAVAIVAFIAQHWPG